MTPEEEQRGNGEQAEAKRARHRKTSGGRGRSIGTGAGYAPHMVPANRCKTPTCTTMRPTPSRIGMPTSNELMRLARACAERLPRPSRLRNFPSFAEMEELCGDEYESCLCHLSR